MFQLFDLIMTSPIGAFFAGVVQDVIYTALMVSDCDECGFNDLGKLLFGGIVLAILVGIVISILVRRAKGNPGFSEGVVSIRTPGRKDDV